MQKPDDLLAFLNQTKCQALIDQLYSELVLIKTDIRDKLGEVETFALGLLQQTKCILQYFLDESDLHASIAQRAYMDRLYRDGDSVLEMLITPGEAAALQPRCADHLDLDYSLGCFEHLQSMVGRGGLKMDPEDPLKLHELGIINENFANMLVTGLRSHATTWQYYALASYYWRLKGDAYQAVECTRRAIHLVPRASKDIPLLSLGTILQRSRQHEDAALVLEAATDFRGSRAENHFALGNSLFFLNHFNRSMQAYDMARSLDDAFKARVDYIENALLCFKYAKTKLDRFDGLIATITRQLRSYDEKKALLEAYMKNMLQQQVPLGEREYFRQPDGRVDVTNDNLAELVQQRGQFCSTRISPGTNEPELFCDFVYDIHMKLETDDIRTDMISTYLEQTADVMKTAKGSLGVFFHVDVNKLDGERFISDKFVVPTEEKTTTAADQGIPRNKPLPVF